MITNELQYNITRKRADQFRKAIDDLVANPSGRLDIQPLLIQAEHEALESQLADLVAELDEYERLKSKSPSVLSIESFDELGEGLIKARIAQGINQKTLAHRLGMKEQQIQEYEATRYLSASYDCLRNVADALGLRIRNEIFLQV